MGIYREIELENPFLFLSPLPRDTACTAREWNEKEGRLGKGRGTSRKKGVEPRHTGIPRGRGTRKRVGGEGTRCVGGRPDTAPDELGQ